MTVMEYVWAGVMAVFAGPEAFSLFGIGISITILMVATGFLLGIVIGATPGLGGPFVMAVSLPILISFFGTDWICGVSAALVNIPLAWIEFGCGAVCSVKRFVVFSSLLFKSHVIANIANAAVVANSPSIGAIFFHGNFLLCVWTSDDL